jgi:hypothetical protein
MNSDTLGFCNESPLASETKEEKSCCGFASVVSLALAGLGTCRGGSRPSSVRRVRLGERSLLESSCTIVGLCRANVYQGARPYVLSDDIVDRKILVDWILWNGAGKN